MDRKCISSCFLHYSFAYSTVEQRGKGFASIRNVSIHPKISDDETNQELLELPADWLVVSNGLSDDIPYTN